jgi:hypothetical protein
VGGGTDKGKAFPLIGRRRRKRELRASGDARETIWGVGDAREGASGFQTSKLMTTSETYSARRWRVELNDEALRDIETFTAL